MFMATVFAKPRLLSRRVSLTHFFPPKYSQLCWRLCTCARAGETVAALQERSDVYLKYDMIYIYIHIYMKGNEDCSVTPSIWYQFIVIRNVTL